MEHPDTEFPQTAPPPKVNTNNDGLCCDKDDFGMAIVIEDDVEKERLLSQNKKSAYNSIGDTTTINNNNNNNDIPTRVYIVAFSAALNSCNLGFDIGVNSPGGMLIQEYYQLRNGQLEMFMGSINFFSLVGAIASSSIISRWGMLLSFFISSIIFIIGIGIMVLSNSFHVLMIGRIFIGMAVGFGFTITPMYIAEISPQYYRGLFVSWSEIGCNIGILLGFTTSLFFNDNLPMNRNWRYMFATGMILPSIVAFFSITSYIIHNYSNNYQDSNNNPDTNQRIMKRMDRMTMMVESPRWLVTKGKEKEALQVLNKLYPPNYNVKQVLVDIKADIHKEHHLDTLRTKDKNNSPYTKSTNNWSYLFVYPPKAVKRMLLVGLSIAIIHQGTGIDAIQYYLVFILQASGIVSKQLQAKYLIVLGIFKFLCLFISMSLVDKVGRRLLLLLSLSGMATALSLISYQFYSLQNHPPETPKHPLATTSFSNLPSSFHFIFFGLVLYLCSFSIGLGPLGWILPPELFSTSIRNKAVSCTTFTNRITATIVTSTMLSITQLITWGGYFILMSILCCFSILFVYFFLPETKNKSLEEMTLFFAVLTKDKETLLQLQQQKQREEIITKQKQQNNSKRKNEKDKHTTQHSSPLPLVDC